MEMENPQKSNEPVMKELAFFDMFALFLSHKWFIILTTLIAAICVLLFSLISLYLPPEKSPLPNRYRPEALILMQDQQRGSTASLLASTNLAQLAGITGMSGISSYGDLAVRLLQSKSILDKIVEEFSLIDRYRIRKNVVSLSRKALLKNSKFVLDKKTNTISISFEDIDPAFASRVVNRFVELLDKRFSSIGGNKNITQRNLLEKKLADVSAEMAMMEEELQQFQKKYGTLTIEALATEQITMLARLRSQLLLKEMEIKTYTDFANIEDPVSKRLKSERDNLLTLVKEMEGGYTSYEKTIPAQNELPDLALKYARLKRDLLVQEKIYEIITQQYELVKLSGERDEPIFQVLELAEVPDLKSSPSRGQIGILITLGAFFASLVAVYANNSYKKYKDKVKGIREQRERSTS